jgi:hypothetical protein
MSLDFLTWLLPASNNFPKAQASQRMNSQADMGNTLETCSMGRL